MKYSKKMDKIVGLASDYAETHSLHDRETLKENALQKGFAKRDIQKMYCLELLGYLVEKELDAAYKTDYSCWEAVCMSAFSELVIDNVADKVGESRAACNYSEVCPTCENEVGIDELPVGTCPICAEAVVVCSMCSSTKCRNCVNGSNFVEQKGE